MRIINELIGFVADLYINRYQIWSLAMRDLKSRVAGSFLGIFWVFFQPFVTIVIFWFVFEIGFKSRPVENFPFILWLSCGMFPWFFFAEALITSTNSITENSYLVKQVAFRVSMLPIVKILSSLIIHFFFIVILFIMFMLYGYYPDAYSLQLFYYLAAMIILLTGLSWITSSTVLFFRDIGQFIQAILQFLFWGTPIFWSLNIIPEQYHTVLKMNPLYYIANGYRESLVSKVWIWEHPVLTVYFWTVTVSLFFLGAAFFKKLRPHFGDVV